MIKEKYEKPFMEVVELKDDVILTSGGSSPYCPSDCLTDIACATNCPSYCSSDHNDVSTGYLILC